MAQFISPYNQRSDSDMNYTIRVEGEGSINVKPDQANINLGVVVEDKVLQNAVDQNARISNQVFEGLYNVGIKKEDIQTITYNINPVYDYVEGKSILRGYEVRHVFRVIVRNIADIGLVIDTATNNGANLTDSIEFTTSHKDYYYIIALQEAIMNARLKAKNMVNVINVELVEVPIWIIENPRQNIARPFNGARLAASDATTIQEGEIIIKASITALFQYGLL